MTRVSKGLAVVDLAPEAIYRSPTNRLCRCLDGGPADAVVNFVYCSANGVQDRSHNPEGFTLTRVNLGLMRRVG